MDSLTLQEYRRYGRQMILNGHGLQGQLSLKSTRLAVVGAGGLGCPALQYLAGAGVGHIAIFDFDTVEESNLHRQVLHSTQSVGEYKAISAQQYLQRLNPLITIEAHTVPLLPSTAVQQLAHYDIVLDCTDRPQTRYLINDAAVRLGIPLVSGAAIEYAGQWCVLGGFFQAGLPRGSTSTSSSDATTTTKTARFRWSVDQAAKPQRPCYRCLFPQPLPRSSASAGTCEEEGVFGPVVGLVGVQMAALALKVILGTDEPCPTLNLISMAPALAQASSGTASLSSTPFRSIRTRGPSVKCIACGPNATINDDDLEQVGYDAFCGVAPSQPLDAAQQDSRGDDVRRIAPSDLQTLFYNSRVPTANGFKTMAQPSKETRSSQDARLLVDVRSSLEYGMCALPGSTSEWT